MGLTIEDCGVVGAGGGGFPTEAKLKAQVPLVIVNGAECEPLLHKDKELLRHEAGAMLAGLKTVMDRVGASEGVVGVKNKYDDVLRALQPVLPAGTRTFPLSDSYPAGDEFILVHDVTGRVIPPGGLPKDVGALVVNVETLVNVGHGRPVTHKYLTVAGAVREPVTLRVPVGTSIGAGKVDAAMVRLDARLERIEAEQRRAAEATGAAFVDVRAEARELRKQLDELRLWRAEVDARSRAAGAR